MSDAPSLSNAAAFSEKEMNSVVQTGVKSPGWLKRTIQRPL